MSSVLGSASEEQKEYVVTLMRDFVGAEGHFAAEQARRIIITQLDYETRAEGELGAKNVYSKFSIVQRV